jgi:hypothetical protein
MEPTVMTLNFFGRGDHVNEVNVRGERAHAWTPVTFPPPVLIYIYLSSKLVFRFSNLVG